MTTLSPSLSGQAIFDQIFSHKSKEYVLIDKQCVLTREGMNLLEAFMVSGDGLIAEKIYHLESESDSLCASNLDALKKISSDLCRACVSIHALQGFASMIVTNMASTGINADWHILEMSAQLRQGVDLLCHGYEKVPVAPDEASRDAVSIVKLRQSIEKSYRAGLVHLLKSDDSATKELASPETMGEIITIFKRQELYKLFREASLEMAHTGKILQSLALQRVEALIGC